jgi:hypothetical protein
MPDNKVGQSGHSSRHRHRSGRQQRGRVLRRARSFPTHLQTVFLTHARLLGAEMTRCKEA